MRQQSILSLPPQNVSFMAGDLKDRIRSLCLEVIRENGWAAFNDISVDVMEKSPHPILAYIDLRNRHITVKIDSEIESIWEQIEKKHEIHFPEFLRTLVHFIVHHEYSHHKTCPFSKERFESILSGIYDALKTRELRLEALEQKIMTIHNMFSDTVINTLNSHIPSEAYRKGLFIAYMLMGFYLQRTKRFFKPRMDKGMTLFISSNLALCQIKHELQENMGRYYARYSYPRVMLKIINIFSGDEKITQEIVSGGKSLITVERMRNHPLWKDMAFKYATIIYPFINQPQKGLSNSFDPNPDESSGQPSPVQEFVGEKESTPKKIPFIARITHDYDTLDRLYRERAGIITLQAESRVLNVPSYEHYVGTEEIDLSEFNHKRIEWGATRISNKSIELHQRNFSLDFDFDSESREISSLPDMAFIFDSSSSMLFKPLEGNGYGEYHYAALAFYSILRDLETKNIAQMLKYNMINFSFSTVSSGWCSYSDIEKVKRALFQYQGNCTVLDPQTIKDLRTNRHDNCVVFMLSDTEFNDIFNAHAILREIKQFDQGISFYLFQLGSPSFFSNAIEKMGFSVHYVTSAEDFMEKTINFTKSRYEISSATR